MKINRFLEHYRPPTLKQIVLYLLGCLLFSIGAKLFIDAKLGTDPLDVLVIGMDGYLQIGMGGCSAIVAVVLLSWWAAWNRQIPPLTPFLTTAMVGYLLDFWNYIQLERYTGSAYGSVTMVIVGLFICSYASSLIIMSGIGIRIMDLLAITMVHKWKHSFYRAKMTLEIALFASGWLLGGPVGMATVMFLFLVGPFIQPFIVINTAILKIENLGFSQPVEG